MALFTHPASTDFLQGFTALGGKDGALGPANLYWNTDTSGVTNETGTIEIAGTAVTGTGTDFTTLEEGSWITVNATPSFIAQIDTITDGDEMTLTTSHTVAAGTSFKQMIIVPLGRTGKIGITDSDKWSPLKFIQQGDSDADNVRTGHETMIEVEIAEAAASLLVELNESYKVTRTGANITGIARTLAIGTRHSEIVKQLTLVVIEDGADSVDNLQAINFFKAAPIFETKVDYDATSQRLVPVKFKIYPDYSKTIDNVPVLWATYGYTGFDA